MSRMRELREDRGMTQKDLADAVTEKGLALKAPTISRYEHTGAGIGVHRLLIVCEVLDCEMRELIGEVPA